MVARYWRPWPLLLLWPILQLMAPAAACDVEQTAQTILQLVQQNQGVWGVSPAGSSAIVANMTKCHGTQLYALKQRVDQSHHGNLVNLVNRNLNLADREKIQQFFMQEFKQTGPQQGIHILSDIDDTIVPRYKDGQFPRTSCYPGGHAFQGLAQGLTCVTARPALPFIDVEEWTQCELDHLQVRPRSILLGSVMNLITAIDQKKLSNIEEYMALFPEKNFIWVGDNGQSDELVGEALDLDPTTKLRVAKSLIHTIDEQRNRRPMLAYFKTYIEAALALYESRLLTQKEVMQVAQGTVTDFQATKFESDQQREQLRTYIEESVAVQPMSHRLAKRIQGILRHLQETLNPV